MEIDIKQYLEQAVPCLSGCMHPMFTTDLSRPTVVYTITHVGSGHMNQSQLELKIIWKVYDDCKYIEARIRSVLCMEEDAPFVNYGHTRFYSVLSGGGMLFNEGCQMYEDTLIFMIDWRNING